VSGGTSLVELIGIEPTTSWERSNDVRFREIVRRHDLVDAWTKFERQFLADTP
jgi:hypothetical protein